MRWCAPARALALIGAQRESTRLRLEWQGTLRSRKVVPSHKNENSLPCCPLGRTECSRETGIRLPCTAADLFAALGGGVAL